MVTAIGCPPWAGSGHALESAPEPESQAAVELVSVTPRKQEAALGQSPNQGYLASQCGFVPGCDLDLDSGLVSKVRVTLEPVMAAGQEACPSALASMLSDQVSDSVAPEVYIRAWSLAGIVSGQPLLLPRLLC